MKDIKCADNGLVDRVREVLVRLWDNPKWYDASGDDCEGFRIDGQIFLWNWTLCLAVGARG